MRERPILMSAPMVRAILDGRKTQTRRASTTSVGIRGHRILGSGSCRSRRCPVADRPGYTIVCSYCGERKHVEHNRRDGGRKRRCCSAECAEARKKKIRPETGESADDAYVRRYCPETRAMFTDEEWARLTEVSRAARMGVAA